MVFTDLGKEVFRCVFQLARAGARQPICHGLARFAVMYFKAMGGMVLTHTTKPNIKRMQVKPTRSGGLVCALITELVVSGCMLGSPNSFVL